MKTETEVLNQDHLKQDEAPFRLDRRELMKLGAGAAGLAALAAAPAAAQEGGRREAEAPPAPGSMRLPGAIAPFTGPGYKNTYNRLGANGPMDDTTAKIVKYVASFKDSDVTAASKKQFDRTMLDSMASVIAGFEEDGPRLAAKIARLSPPGKEKCTVLGYNIATTPELATFANGCLIREVDFDDTENGGHYSTVIPAALAVGEALHCSGAQVMAAITIAYELQAVSVGGEPVVAAVAAGRLMGLDEDRMANAITLALTPHVALNKGVGALSMWKGMRSAESAKCGVWAAIMAREGVTGPPQPYEGRGGYWSYVGANGRGMQRNGMARPFTLPVNADSQVIQFNWFKRRPAEASSQGILYVMPEIRAFVKPNEIAHIHWDTSYGNWEEICDPPKWDPRNRQTADHSLPYIVARAIMDGDVYMDSFTEDKYMDPVARGIMDKTTMAGVNGWSGNGTGRLTITKTNGEVKVWETYDGRRTLDNSDYPSLTEQELRAKFDRAAAFKKVTNAQRDQAFKVWGDLSSLSDIGIAMKQMATFGQPKPL